MRSSPTGVTWTLRFIGTRPFDHQC
jgi:hypothetical protein